MNALQAIPVIPETDPFAELHRKIDQLAELSQSQSIPGAARDAASVSAPARRPSRRKDRTMTETTTTPAPVPGSNAPSFQNLLQVATELGEQAGKGKDVQVKFALKLLEGATLGVIDLAKNKHGKDKDDAVALAEAYVKAQGSANIFDAKAPNQQKLISTARTFIKFGGYTHGGAQEPMATTNKLLTIRAQLRRDKTYVGRLDDAFNTLIKFARTQMKRTTMIDGDELRAFCFRSTPDPRTAAEVLRSIQKLAAKLAEGKVPNCPDMDDSPEVKSIINACNKRMAAIAKAQKGGQQAA